WVLCCAEPGQRSRRSSIVRHLNDGLLRLSVDEPCLVSEGQHVHLRECMACQRRRQEISASAARVSRILVEGGRCVDAQGALPRAGGPGGRLAAAASAIRAAHRRPVALVAATLAMLSAGAISVLAQDLVTLLAQPHRAVVVPVPPADAAGLAALADYGTIS